MARTQGQFSGSVASMRPYFVRLSYPWKAQEVASARTHVAPNKVELIRKMNNDKILNANFTYWILVSAHN